MIRLFKDERLPFLLIMLVHLIPIWLVQYFPSQDGPVHLENAAIFNQYQDAGAEIFRTFYSVEIQPLPNWFSHLSLAGLMRMVPPLLAEKLLLSLYILLLPLSARYAMGAFGRVGSSLSYLSFPLIYNYFFHMGFYNHCFGLALFFMALGFWIRRCNEFTVRHAFLFSLFLIGFYFTHFFPLMMAFLALAIVGIASAIADRRTIKDGKTRSAFLRSRLIWPLLAVLPALFLCLFFIRYLNCHYPLTFYAGKKSFLSIMKTFWDFPSLVSFRPIEWVFAHALVLLFVGLGTIALWQKIKARRFDRWDSLLAVAGAYVILHFFVRTGFAEQGLMYTRLNMFPYLALLIWLAAQVFSDRMIHTARTIAVGLSLLALGLHATKYKELNHAIEQYLSGGEMIKVSSTVLPLSYAHRGRDSNGNPISERIQSFLHLAAHHAIARQSVEFTNFAANTVVFPIRFRPEVNPYTIINPQKNCYEETIPCASFSDYEKKSGESLDYVLIWGMQQDHKQHERTQGILNQLTDGYELVHESPQGGMSRLYKRKNGAN